MHLPLSTMRLPVIGILGLLVATVAFPGPAEAQEAPLKGMVWRQPDDLQAAFAHLYRMEEMGVEAVRVLPIADERLLRLADTLGLQYYQDLPVARFPAARLRDSLSYAKNLLRQMLTMSNRYGSVGAFGLARNSDTSDSTACTYFEQLTEYVRVRGGSGARTYYVTDFVEDDACGSVVDFVLLDARGAAEPYALLERYQKAHPEVSVGIGALGKWVDPDAPPGLNVERSAEQQARYLERSLLRLFDPATEIEPVAVFVYRLRDAEREFASPAYDLENPYEHTFGLFTERNQPRPAAEVVSGVYGDAQRVFAFSAGARAGGDWPVPLIVGWIVFLILAVLYAASPRFRQTVPRYFSAHGFYREAVREGREILGVTTLFLLVALSLAVGTLWVVVLEVWRTTGAFLLVYDLLPAAAEEGLVGLLARPLMLILVIAGAYAAILFFWSLALALGARFRYPLNTAQAMMLAIWPRWPILLLLLGAMVVSTLPTETAFVPSLYLAGIWIAVTAYATVRALVDLQAITHLSPGRMVVGALVNPLVIIAVAALLVALRYGPELAFAWHAVTRS